MTTSAPPKDWRPRPWPVAIQEQNCRALAAELQIPLPIALILFGRGLTDSRTIESFLHPTLAQLPAPQAMKGLPEAAALIGRAAAAGRPIAVFGDYDVDGVTGTAVLVEFMKTLGLAVFDYQPNRLTEGYGLNMKGITRLAEQCGATGKSGVLLTVDCGISNVEEVRQAKALGFTVIVTDHHEPPPQLPAADAILNPRQPGCAFPFKDLAGVGVAFYLVMGLRRHLQQSGFWQERPMPNLKKYLDLVAIGTIADLVPLTGANRIFVKAGLEIMTRCPRPGLSCLMEVAGLAGRPPAPEDIAFRLGPRLNAAGRCGTAEKAVRLLTTTSLDEARVLAADLDAANNRRKELEQQVFTEALAQAGPYHQAGDKALVLDGSAWHRGILGIVASRLTELFYRPTILLSTDNGRATGSGRSIAGLNLHGILTAGADLLDRYGGHAGACGLALPAENIDRFRRRFAELVAARVAAEDLIPKLWIDRQNCLAELADAQFLAYYAQLSPFGTGNPEPVFTSGQTSFISQRLVGDRHLRFAVKANGIKQEGIGFGFGYLAAASGPEKIDLAFHLRLNEFRGEKKWELNLVDVKCDPSG